MTDENGQDEEHPYIYIHILPKVTGEKFQREIVSIDAIKKFSYEEYKKKPSIYKATKFKFRRGPDGEKSHCHVLYAGGNY